MIKKLLPLLAIVLTISLSNAQVVPGYAVSGSVQSSGSPVSGASITITGSSSGFLWSGVTQQNGWYDTDFTLNVSRGETLTVNATLSGFFGSNSAQVPGVGSSQQINVTMYDVSEPVVTLYSPTDYANTSDNTPSFQYKVVDNTATLSCVLYVDGTSKASDASVSNNTVSTLTSTTLSNGRHEWHINCSDARGNKGMSESRTLTVDTAAPNVQPSEPANYFNTSSRTVNFSFTATDNLFTTLTCSLYINNSLKGTNNSVGNNTPTTITATSSDGTYSWHVNCTDAVGNTGQSAVRTLTIDSTPPNVSNLLATPSLVNKTQSVNITVTITDSSRISVAYANVTWSSSSQRVTLQNTSTLYSGTFSNTTWIGIYTVRIFANDSLGNINNTETTTFSVAYILPVADAKANGQKNITVHAGTFVNLSGSSSLDPDGMIIFYQWFDSLNEANSTGENITVQMNLTGLHLITLNITDDDGLTAADAITINVTNTAPVANFTTTPSVANISENILFNSTSQDSDNDALTYYWDFGDGANSTLENPAHNYTIPGTYNVTLTVTDPFSASSNKSSEIVILLNGKYPPNAIAYVNGLKTVSIHLGVRVNLTSNSTDLDNDITSHAWTDSLGDIIPAQQNVTNFLFTYAGIHSVTLNVTDAVNLSDTDIITINVTNTAPVANATANGNTTLIVNLSENIRFNSTSQDPDNDTLAYLWDFKDGTNSTQQNPEHNYSQSGSYEVTLTVFDGSLNGSMNSTATVIVFVRSAAGVPPFANAGSDRAVIANHTIFFNASLSQDPDGYIINYTWSFPDTDENLSGIYVNHTFTSYGIYTLTLNVTDNSSLSDTDTVQITVTSANITVRIDGNLTTNFQQAGKPHNLTIHAQLNPVSGYSGANLSGVKIQILETNGYNTFALPQYTDSNVTNYAIAEVVTDATGNAKLTVIPTGGLGINEQAVGNYSLSVKVFFYNETASSLQTNYTLSERRLLNPAAAYTRIPNRGDINFFVLDIPKIYDKIKKWSGGEVHYLTVYTNGTVNATLNLTAGKPTGLIITVRNATQPVSASIRVTETNGYNTFALPQYTDFDVTNYAIAETATNPDGVAQLTVIPTGGYDALGHEAEIGNYSVNLKVIVDNQIVYSDNLAVTRELVSPAGPSGVTVPNQGNINYFMNKLIILYDKLKRWLQ